LDDLANKKLAVGLYPASIDVQITAFSVSQKIYSFVFVVIDVEPAALIN